MNKETEPRELEGSRDLQCNCTLIAGAHTYADCVPLLNERTKRWNAQQGDGYPLAPLEESARTEDFETLIWRFVHAQSRMCDRWAEGDDAVKKNLWQALHAAGNDVREYIDRNPITEASAGLEQACLWHIKQANDLNEIVAMRDKSNNWTVGAARSELKDGIRMHLSCAEKIRELKSQPTPPSPAAGCEDLLLVYDDWAGILNESHIELFNSRIRKAYSRDRERWVSVDAAMPENGVDGMPPQTSIYDWNNQRTSDIAYLLEERKRMMALLGDWQKASYMRLHAGVMSAQEVRTVQAVLKSIESALLEAQDGK